MGSHYAMYAFDKSGRSTADYSVWPAQNMPLEYFNKSYPWSFSVGRYVNKKNVKIVIKRERDGKKWKFSKKKSEGAFYIDNNSYGLVGCIIFRPKNIGTIKKDDVYEVTITGLEQGIISYKVKFFSLEDALNSN